MKVCTVLGLLAGLACSLALLSADESPRATSQPTSTPTSRPASAPTTRPVDTAKVAELIRDLADDSVKVREAATKDLIQAGTAIRPTLEAALKDDKLDPEAAMRIKLILNAIQQSRELTLDLGNKVTMTFAPVPAGKFMMGSPRNEKGAIHTDGPPHEETISDPFYMGIYPVTQEQYQAVMGKNPSEHKGASLPVEDVSWDDAMEFCKVLSQKTGKVVRLPSEAQWEYACRAGSTTRFCYGDDDDYSQLAEYGWFTKDPYNKTRPVGEEPPARTHPVGQKKPNKWGLYDMHGNIHEWCADKYTDYMVVEDSDPKGLNPGGWRIIRSCTGDSGPEFCRSASRCKDVPTNRIAANGFRVMVEDK